MILETIYTLILIIFFLIGFYIIYKQVAMVKKGDFKFKDRIQCVVYGILFSFAVMIVVSIALAFAMPGINSLLLLVPFFICLLYISIYPIIDFTFIAFNEETSEGLTPFHNVLSKYFINKSNNKFISLILAIMLYCIMILPPLILSLIGVPFLFIWLTFTLVYPLMILTYYGSKGYIAGISHQFYHIPYMKRYIFLNFEDGKRGRTQFLSKPLPYILFGLMLFVFIWAWISLFQSIGFFFTGSLAISTMSSSFVYVTLFFGVVGYFTRFWGRKVKYRGIDIYFAAYLMAAIGINVLINFLVVNIKVLTPIFNSWSFTQPIIPTFRDYTWPAVIEEITLIIFTSYFLISVSGEFRYNIKYSKITDCARKFDAIPLFNFVKDKNPQISDYAEKSLILMFERIPLKTNVNLKNWQYIDLLFDCLSDSHPKMKAVSIKILTQLEKDIPQEVLKYIIKALKSPNYEKVFSILNTTLTAESTILEQVPSDYFFNLIRDNEWRVKQLSLEIIKRLLNKKIIKLGDINLKRLLTDQDVELRSKILDIYADNLETIPIELLKKVIAEPNKIVKAAAIRNLKNLKQSEILEFFHERKRSLLAEKDTNIKISVLEVLTNINNVKEFNLDTDVLIQDLTNQIKLIREYSGDLLMKLYHQKAKYINLDLVLERLHNCSIENSHTIIKLLDEIWDLDPLKILKELLVLLKSKKTSIKELISDILIRKSEKNLELILENLISIRADTKFITKGIVAKTITNIANKFPDFSIPFLNESLISDQNDRKLNAVLSLEGLAETNIELIDLNKIVSLIKNDKDEIIKKEASQILSEIGKSNPSLIKPIITDLFEILDDLGLSVKIILMRSLLEIAKFIPESFPVSVVIEKLADEDSFIREMGIKILGLVGYKVPIVTIDALIDSSLKDNEWNVREAAITSIGELFNYITEKEKIVPRLINLLDDKSSWVKRSSMKLLSSIKALSSVDLPYEKIQNEILDEDAKVREGITALMKIYLKENDTSSLEDSIKLLGDESIEVRNSMINVLVEIINDKGLDPYLSRLLQNLSDETSITTQRSICAILDRTARYSEEKIKKRIISLLKIRCDISQDPFICEILAKFRENRD